MADIIPLSPELLRYETRMNVAGVELVFELQWRERVQAWYLSIREEDGTPVLLGRRIVAEWSPTLRRRTTQLPDGLFLVARQGDGLEPAGKTELGKDVLFYFLSEAEVDELTSDASSVVRRVVIV